MIVFVDTSAWIALLTRNDQSHQAALTVQAQLRHEKARLLTSDYVVDETITWLRYRVGHAAAVDFGEMTRRSQLTEVTPINLPLLDAAWDIFKKYADQEFSFTDCTSFALMQAVHVNRVFSFDHHFRVMGFTVLG